MQTPDFRSLVHSPADLSQEYVAWAERIQKYPGLTFGIPAIDKVVMPIRPGELISFIARPGHGKTSLLAFFARQQARRIMAAGNKKDVVVYCTWEQSAEELEGLFQSSQEYSAGDVAWGRVDLKKVKKQAVKRGKLPIWIIGHGMGRAGANVPRMTPEAVLRAVETMEVDFGVRVALMLFDYIQIIPTERPKDRVQQVTEMPILIRELALRLGAPALVGVQAGRQVDDRDVKLPEMRDAQWASSIEQTSDKVFGLWRPWQTEQAGQMIKLWDGPGVEVTRWLFLMRMLKQRGWEGRHTWALHFEPHLLRLAALERGDHADLQF